MQRPITALQARSSAPRGKSLARVLLFAFWALVLWGTLLDLAALWMLVTRGTHGTWEALQSFATPNALLAVLAPLVWLTVGWMLVLGREPEN